MLLVILKDGGDEVLCNLKTVPPVELHATGHNCTTNILSSTLQKDDVFSSSEWNRHLIRLPFPLMPP